MFELSLPGAEPDDLELAARRLSASPRFEVLRRLPSPVERPEAMSTVGNGRRLAILLDTETTGLDHRTDVVVEIAAVAVTYDDLGLHDVVGSFEGLQDPGRPLDPAVARLTGLSDADLVGRSIDLGELEHLVRPASLVVAHNAGFDRPFCERLSPVFADMAWACSMTEIDWQARGTPGRTLGQLLRDVGFFHAGHRALADVHALDRVLRGRCTTSPSPAPFGEMLRRARMPTVEISAIGAPFAVRDVLKKRGYRWRDVGNGGRAWSIVVSEADEGHELEELERICGGHKAPAIRRRTAFDRYR